MRMRKTFFPLALSAAVALTACQADAPSAADAGKTAAPSPNETPASPTPETPAPEATDARSVLAGKVWRVERSDAAEVGSTYAFLDDGALVIDSPNGTPMTGSWAVGADGKLSMTEEGVSYPTDLVVTDADHVTLRSHNPGGVAEIALVRASDVPLPSSGQG